MEGTVSKRQGMVHIVYPLYPSQSLRLDGCAGGCLPFGVAVRTGVRHTPVPRFGLAKKGPPEKLTVLKLNIILPWGR